MSSKILVKILEVPWYILIYGGMIEKVAGKFLKASQVEFLNKIMYKKLVKLLEKPLVKFLEKVIENFSGKLCFCKNLGGKLFKYF